MAAAAAPSSPFSPMDRALAAFARGEFVVVMDDEGRENEGDLLIAASECTTEKMAWFIKHTSCVPPPRPIPLGRRSPPPPLPGARADLTDLPSSSDSSYSGYICIALPGETLAKLEIPMMVERNEETNQTAYTVTVDYRHGAS
jgi:3,4-dihydroxy-2-butanone 4-phosphate synthase